MRKDYDFSRGNRRPVTAKMLRKILREKLRAP